MVNLRKREYLSEAGKSMDIDIPLLSKAVGRTFHSRRQDYRDRKTHHISDVKSAVSKILTWTKGKNAGEQWSVIRLVHRDGKEQDIFINFYSHFGSAFAPKGSPISLVVFDRQNSQKNMFSAYAKTVREVKKVARDWLSKYVADHYVTKITRISTKTKRPARKLG